MKRWIESAENQVKASTIMN